MQLANLQHVTYSYDDRNRLTNAVSLVNQYSASYNYDNDGHMTTRNFFGINNSFNRETASHRIANIIENGASKSVSYDSRGSLTFDALSNWTTNEFNRSNLPLYMNRGNKSYRFGYNEKGERITKDFEDDSAETKEKYLLDFLGRTLVVYDNNRNKEGIINGNGLVGSIAVTDSSTNYYYFLKDHLGNIRTTVDANSTITTARDFAPYGEALREYTAEETVDRYQYTEKERDKESRDTYFGARSLNGYFPFWKSVDPLAEKYPGASPYSYAMGNPMRFVDPKGSYLAETADGSDPEEKEKGKNRGQNNAVRQLNYVAPQGLTPELTLSFIIKMKLIRAEMIAKEVLAETHSKASELPGGTKGLHNGPADAWRHARWNERMIKEIDPITAFVAGVGHELENLFNGGPLDEILMDLHNNAVGRSGESPDKLLKEGKLRIIQKPFKNKGERYYP